MEPLYAIDFLFPITILSSFIQCTWHKFNSFGWLFFASFPPCKWKLHEVIWKQHVSSPAFHSRSAPPRGAQPCSLGSIYWRLAWAAWPKARMLTGKICLALVNCQCGLQGSHSLITKILRCDLWSLHDWATVLFPGNWGSVLHGIHHKLITPLIIILTFHNS